ncbi:endonuclease/exonuclease/phosphatase family protein [Streptomyces sp. NPDC051561]|uniref:endonuclease/exonuclease/phosphatase family protein n=1 Tax=Streptomyces sp. NPDC051561 TaxID=3365658 RepID=UPI00378E5F83
MSRTYDRDFDHRGSYVDEDENHLDEGHVDDDRGHRDNWDGSRGEDRRRRPRTWPEGRHWGRDGKGRGSWRRGRLIALCAVALGLLPVLHALVPDFRGVGSLLETFLPWAGLVVLPLLLMAWWRRSTLALVALLVPAGAWGGLAGNALTAFGGSASYDFRVVQHNIADDNPDPAGAARALAGAGPAMIALEEVTPGVAAKVSGVLKAEYPHRAVLGTVGLWSRFPLRDVRPLDLKPRSIAGPWQRGLRATALTTQGHVAVYVAHLPSVRAGWPEGLRTGPRNEAAERLGAALEAETVDRVLLLGDLNGTTDDRGLDPVVSRFDDAGRGFVFSWPRRFPVVRLDHVMVRGAEIVRLDTLAVTDSDHVPVIAELEF